MTMTQSRTPNASRPRSTLALLLFIALDIAGIVLFFTGVMWFIHGESRLIPGFPTGTPSAVISIIGGFLLMVVAASRILIALFLHKHLKNRESGQ
ncbi:hypothetical protein AGMMS50256_13280 [Betaproteobacteria bacterium]|nr:hypothetical protein AGMMS50256_13280 [Betaproteobacteria bacterium]